jgi:carboxyl-terminal processing protease
VLAQHDAKPESAITDLPLVVIVDRTTAGASEVVAAAILENQRGELVGERTLFGMGGEQELFPLDDGSALLLTTARYASPSGKILMAEGVSPTVEVKRIDIPELQATDDEPEQNQPRTPGTDQPQNTPPPIVVAPKPTEDLMLKKAIEVVTSGAKAKKRAA